MKNYLYFGHCGVNANRMGSTPSGQHISFVVPSNGPKTNSSQFLVKGCISIHFNYSWERGDPHHQLNSKGRLWGLHFQSEFSLDTSIQFNFGFIRSIWIVLKIQNPFSFHFFVLKFFLNNLNK
jgi:hypothetical protein